MGKISENPHRRPAGVVWRSDDTHVAQLLRSYTVQGERRISLKRNKRKLLCNHRKYVKYDEIPRRTCFSVRTLFSILRKTLINSGNEFFNCQLRNSQKHKQRRHTNPNNYRMTFKFCDSRDLICFNYHLGRFIHLATRTSPRLALS